MSGLSPVIEFEGIGECFYEVLGRRAPRENEFYLSGAIVMAYRARCHLDTLYTIVRPTFRAKKCYYWERGVPV